MPPEEEKKEEKQEGAQEPPNNGAPVPENLESIKAQLEEERKAKAAAEASLAERDTRIAELEAHVTALKDGFDTQTNELTALKDANSKAVAKYLDAVKLATPTIPGDVIAGSTIDEIDAAVAKALSIATAVKATLEAQAKEAKVPAGAPPRGEISLEGLSPREKIAAGIQQKGGTS
jgi:hypothetical protein